MTLTDPYSRAYTFTRDWNGGIKLVQTASGTSAYFPRGDEAAAADNRYDYLVGECGYDGQTALALMWAAHAPEFAAA